jgi:hypothetical protein
MPAQPVLRPATFSHSAVPEKSLLRARFERAGDPGERRTDFSTKKTT